MKLSKSRLFQAALLAVLIIGFQNCGQAFISTAELPSLNAISNATTPPPEPSPVPSDPLSAEKVLGFGTLSAGIDDSLCTLNASGDVLCTGTLPSGNGTTEAHVIHNRLEKIEGLPKIVSIQRSCALAENKKVYCWGKNFLGQAGADPAVVGFQSTPTILSISESVTELSGSCALLVNGHVKCWGDVGLGLGDGVDHSSAVFVPVEVKGIQTAKKIFNGNCAILTDGAIHCWGHVGQNGMPITEPVLVYKDPTVIDGAGTLQASGGGGQPFYPSEFCLLKNNGKVWCRTGQNDQNYFTMTEKSPLTDVVQLEASSGSICSRSRDGRVHCWGINMFGRLGFVFIHWEHIDIPHEVIEWAGARSIALSNYWSCASLSDTSLKCIGDINLPLIDLQSRMTTDSDLNLASKPLAYKIGPNDELCATYSGAPSLCWSRLESSGNYNIQRPGFARVGGYWVSQPVVSKLGNFDSGDTTCFIDSNRDVRCVGDNTSGQLGNGSTVSSENPVLVTGLHNVVSIKGTRDRKCAMTLDGKLFCWGSFRSYLFQDQDHVESDSGWIVTTPKQIQNVNPVKEFAFLSESILLLNENGNLQFLSDPSGIRDFSSLSGVKTIKYFSNGGCFVMIDKSLKCEEYDSNFQFLGFRTKTNIQDNGKLFFSGSGTICSVNANKTAQCAGKNSDGQLGQGDRSNYSGGVTVKGVDNISQIFAIDNQSVCALVDNESEENSKVICWGYGGINSDSNLTEPRELTELRGYKPVLNFEGYVSHTFTNRQGKLKTWYQLKVPAVPFSIYKL